jgi:hypothetical protein
MYKWYAKVRRKANEANDMQAVGWPNSTDEVGKSAKV